VSSKPEPPEFLKNIRIPPTQLDSLPLLGKIPAGLVPQPLPLSFSTSAVQGSDGKGLVAIQMTTPGGVQFYFFDPASAKKFAEFILMSARTAETGLVVPPTNGST
jgi:hypothetical protein